MCLSFVFAQESSSIYRLCFLLPPPAFSSRLLLSPPASCFLLPPPAFSSRLLLFSPNTPCSWVTAESTMVGFVGCCWHVRFVNLRSGDRRRKKTHDEEEHVMERIWRCLQGPPELRRGPPSWEGAPRAEKAPELRRGPRAENLILMSSGSLAWSIHPTAPYGTRGTARFPLLSYLIGTISEDVDKCGRCWGQLKRLRPCPNLTLGLNEP